MYICVMAVLVSACSWERRPLGIERGMETHRAGAEAGIRSGTAEAGSSIAGHFVSEGNRSRTAETAKTAETGRSGGSGGSRRERAKGSRFKEGVAGEDL